MRAVTVALFGLAVACGGGAAPTITAITSLEPSSVPVGVVTVLGGKVAVTDEDGDLASLRVKLTPPSGQIVETTIDVAAEAGAARNSTVSLQLQVRPLEAGRFEIELAAVDAEGNESEPKTVSFEAADVN